jgi:exodeoxyribonuclease-3
VNSLRVRLPHVQEWLNTAKPDVLALQETKLPDADFPFDAIHEAGYNAVASGQRTYNGVAILSREKVSDIITDIPELDDPQRRVLFATIGDIGVLNIYVPNGESVGSEKYQYKLNWLHKLDLFLKHQLKKHSKIIVLGDFNIAPDEIDVHDPKLWDGQVLFSQPERKAFKDMLAVGFQDCFRMLQPAEKSYSWWDYRMNAFRRNMGLRIDHILASETLAAYCTRCYIDKTPRSLERPSDHAPVVAEFKL